MVYIMPIIKNGIVSLQMIDVANVEDHKTHYFLNTGSPHHVELVNDLDNYNVKENGSLIRYGAPYFNEGTNVNFVEKCSDNTIKVRTYERGVEDETLSCGTGVTAAALATFNAGIVTDNTVQIKALGGNLNVSFKNNNIGFTNVFLEGAATFVFEGTFEV